MSTEAPGVLLLSHRGVDQLVWRASQYEFEDVVAAVAGGVVLAPPGAPAPPPAGVGGLVRRLLLSRRRPGPAPAPLLPAHRARSGAADVFFAVFSAPGDVRDLQQVDGWQDSALKIAFLVELWAPQVDSTRDRLAELAGFDHVFVFSRGSIPALEAITGRPCHYLDTAVDALLFAPTGPRPPGRSIDVYAYGRGSAVTHAALVEGLRAGRVSYVFPTVEGRFSVTDHREHRLVTAHLLQRSVFTVVTRINDSPERVARTGGEEALTNRYFEALAGGCVMLGTAARTDDFTRAFPWQDAIVPVEPDEPRIVDIVEALRRDPDRLRTVSATNVVQSLRRHDWAHRWAQIAAVTGLGTTPALDRRLEELEAAASEVERRQLR